MKYKKQLNAKIENTQKYFWSNLIIHFLKISSDVDGIKIIKRSNIWENSIATYLSDCHKT
ncbi:MAG: hypothetical protein ACRC4M_00405 [Mycoplasma sp.]